MKNNKDDIEIKKLSDLFARYLFGRNGSEDLLEDLVNAILILKKLDLEIIDPFNLSENIDFL